MTFSKYIPFLPNYITRNTHHCTGRIQEYQQRRLWMSDRWKHRGFVVIIESNSALFLCLRHKWSAIQINTGFCSLRMRADVQIPVSPCQLLSRQAQTQNIVVNVHYLSASCMIIPPVEGQKGVPLYTLTLS